MIHELEKLLSAVPAMLKDPDTWGSLRIDKFPPVIHRLYRPIGPDRTLYLHHVFDSQNYRALMHSHSWAFACRVLRGGYEMGIGHAAGRATPPVPGMTVEVRAGQTYEMLDENLWHYTKTQGLGDTYSVLLVGPRKRERLAQNDQPLDDETKSKLLQRFRELLTPRDDS